MEIHTAMLNSGTGIIPKDVFSLFRMAWHIGFHKQRGLEGCIGMPEGRKGGCRNGEKPDESMRKEG